MKLNHLADKNLLAQTKLLATKEREILSQILWHLREIDQRKLYSDLKCSSLFDYCVKVLKYSEGQASRRVTASRMLKEMPEISAKIEAGELSLMQLNQAKHFFDEMKISNKAEKKEVIKMIAGKSVRETEKELWALKKEDVPRREFLSLSEDAIKLLKKTQSRYAHKYKNMDQLIIKMCQDIDNVWDRTIARKKSKLTETNSRYVPVQVREMVWEKSQYKCQNCGSSYALEIDHIKPFAQGGKTSLDNLQLLCRNCNQRKGLVFSHKKEYLLRYDNNK